MDGLSTYHYNIPSELVLEKEFAVAGIYFDELEIGAIFQHQPPREISHSDNLQFCKMTYNPQPLHFDEEFAAASEYGQIIINSLYTLGSINGA